MGKRAKRITIDVATGKVDFNYRDGDVETRDLNDETISEIQVKSGLWDGRGVEEFEEAEPEEKPVEEMTLPEYEKAYGQGTSRQDRAARRFEQGDWHRQLGEGS
jgi:hypothetical protein